MKYAEVNWIVVIIFAIGLISQIVEALKRKKGGGELPPPDPRDRPHSPPSRPDQQEETIDALLESLGLPRSSREDSPPPLGEEVATARPSPPKAQAPEPYSEGPQFERLKESSRERYASPFSTPPESNPRTNKIERINFDEDLEATENSSLNISASRFQVINARQGVGDIRKQLKTPAALRQAFILKEILDPPKGLAL